jgi:hypothetical protein
MAPATAEVTVATAMVEDNSYLGYGFGPGIAAGLIGGSLAYGCGYYLCLPQIKPEGW